MARASLMYTTVSACGIPVKEEVERVIT